MQFVKNNYYGPHDHGPQFTVHINPLPVSHRGFFRECLAAAEEIDALKVGKLHLLYSGGLDSENVLSVFLHAGIPIVPVIINMIQGYNTHDTDYAFKFCKVRGIKPLVINVDFDHFVTSGKILEVARVCRTEIYHRALTAHIAEQLDGTVLCGDGEMYIRLNKTTSQWEVHMDEHEFAVYRYFAAKGIHGTTHFNTYRPEMMSAMITDPIMVNLANNRYPNKLGSNSSKHMIYNRESNFNLVARPKFHGYERVMESAIFKHPHFQQIREQGKMWNGSYDIEYSTFLRKFNLCTQ